MERLSSYEADRLNDALYGMDKDGVEQTQVSARYVRTDSDGMAWVRFEGADKDTPLTSAMSVRAREGDIIDVSLGGYEAVGGGNRTDPSAGFQDVRAVTVEVEHVKGKQAEFEKVTAQELEADKARIGQLEADSAEIEELVAQKATIAELEAAEGRITSLESDHVSTTDLQAVNGEITNLKAKDATIEGNITAATGRIGTIEADYLKAADMTAEQARVNNLLAGKATVNDLNAATGRITVLESTKANIADIEANYITADDIEATYMHADMTNSDVAWIQNGVIANGAISSAMINDVSANKLTAGTINGSVINVTNLNADNITAGTINGQRIGEGSLSLDKLSEDVYTEAEVDAKLSTMQAEIDGAIETWTGTEVPTLNNAPASNWSDAATRDTHVGDVYFVVNSQSQQNGYNYRFTKTGSTYSWQLIKDTDITNALQRIQTAEGQITQFDSDISTLKTDTGTLKTKTQSLETSLGDKVDTTTFNELSSTVDENSASITSMSTVLTNNGLTSSTNITNTVNTVNQTASGNSSKISQLTTTLGTNADGTTKENDIVHRTSAIEQDVSGFKQTVSETYATKSEAKQTDSDSGKREIVTEDAAELPLLALTAYGECSQDGTPTPDAPVEIRSVRGRNLFKAKYANMIVNTNGTIAVSTGVNVYVAAVSRNTDYVVSAIGKDRCTVTKVPSENISGGMSGTSLIVANANASTFNSGDADYVAVYLCSTGTEAEPQLEVGSTPTPYVPYGCIGVLSHGKNLNKAVDGSGTNTSTKLTTTVKDSVYTIVGTSESTGGRLDTVYKHSFFIIPAGTYTMSVGASGTGRLSEILHRYSDNTILARIDGVDNGAVTFTLSQSECVFIGINSNDNSTTYNKTVRIQLELGTEATDYEPYRESVSYIDLNGEELDYLDEDYKDTLTVDASGHAVIDKRCGRKTIGENGAWVYNYDYGVYWTKFTDMLGQDVTSGTVHDNTHPLLSNEFVHTKGGSNVWGGGADTIGYFTRHTVAAYPRYNHALFFRISSTPSPTEFAEQYADVEVVYPLSEPRTVDLGYIDLPTTFPHGTVHVEAEIQPVIDGSWWTSAGYEAGKAYNGSSADLAALTERVTVAESEITQNAHDITLKVSESDVTGNYLVGKINLTSTTATIAADRVNIEGAAIFTSGRLSQTSLDGTYDASGAASAAQAAAISAAAADATSKSNAAQTAATNAANQATDQKLTSYSTTQQMNQAISNGTANLATKANAVKRSQRIYYRKSASGAPAAPGEASSAWVTNGNTDSGWTKYNAWSTRIPPIAESNAEGATKYLYLYTCEQREMGDGTLAYTTVLLDDSATVIDGGNIITGSVAANKLDVYDATIQKIRADAIDAASITIGQSQVTGLTSTLNGKASTTDVANAAKRTYVSIRATAIDYAADTATLEATLYTDGVATTTGVTYAWLMDGTAISGATSRTYSVPASSGLSHAYSCKATW